jgi:hypothetical protein
LPNFLDSWFWETSDRSAPWETPRPSFVELPMLEHFHRRPFHSIEVRCPLDLKALLDDYRPKIWRSEGRLSEKAKPKLECVLMKLENEVFAYFESPVLRVYASTLDKAIDVATQFHRYVRPPKPEVPGFFLLRTDDYSPEPEFVPVKRLVTLSDEGAQLHYGDDFVDWEQEWLQLLTQRSSGVSILYGPPGCGKTTYLRTLMAKLMPRCVFYYLPISEFEALSNPRFVKFWLQESRQHGDKQKLAILEDAEELLLPRDEGSRAKVSNLLNIGDGFLGDHLNLQVIATTNVPMHSLDPAVTRPGRLMGAREFPRLSRESAFRLAEAKGITTLPEQTDYSLAEIYCRAPLAAKLQKARRFGFA